MNKQQLIAAINEYITSNGVQEITGQVMNLILNSIANVIPDDAMLTSSFGGVVKSTDVLSTTPGLGRWFIAKAGTYPNYGSFTFLSKNINILSYDGIIWDKAEIEMPIASVNIRRWKDLQPSDFPLTEGNQVVTDSGFFTVGIGKTVSNIDIPGISDKWNILGGIDKECRNVLKWFITGEEFFDRKLQVNDSNKNLYGVDVADTQLTQANILITDLPFPFYSWLNIPLHINPAKYITKIDLKVVRYGGSTSANLLGIKDNGEIDVLLGAIGSFTGLLENFTFDVTNYKYISYSFFADGQYPATLLNEINFFTSDMSGGGNKEDGVKKYITEQIAELNDNLGNIAPSSERFNSRITIEGQSNAYGYGTSSDIVTQQPFSSMVINWLKAFSRVFIWNPNTEKYENLQLKINNTGYYNPAEIDRFGVEVGIALIWLQTHKFGNLYIDKHCENGQPISYFQKGTSFYNSRLVPRKSGANNWLSERNITVQESAFVWIQGESDMNNSQSYYLTSLKKIVSDRIADKFITLNSNIIIAQVNPQNTMFSQNIFNAKQEYLAFNKRAKTITYPNLTWDGVHLTASGQINLGLECGRYCFETDIYTIEDIEAKTNWNV